jgi:hypothetical protein
MICYTKCTMVQVVHTVHLMSIFLHPDLLIVNYQKFINYFKPFQTHFLHQKAQKAHFYPSKTLQKIMILPIFCI